MGRSSVSLPLVAGMPTPSQPPALPLSEPLFSIFCAPTPAYNTGCNAFTPPFASTRPPSESTFATATLARMLKVSPPRPHSVSTCKIKTLNPSLNSCSPAAVSNFKPRCKGWAVYEELVLKAASTYNITNVYLATDDDAIIAAARATQERSGGKLKFLFANIDREGLFASSWFLECVRHLFSTEFA